MSANNLQSENMFDQMLRRNLRKYIEPIRPDFTDNVLKQVKLWEEQKILSKILLQERLALVSGASLFVIIVTMIMYLGKDIMIVLNLLLHDSKEAITTIRIANLLDWQLVSVLVVTAGFGLYCFVDNVQPVQLIKKFLSQL
ncbi:MAG: hypothetical protein ABIG61_10220 [Planctomycetota bacterium]